MEEVAMDRAVIVTEREMKKTGFWVKPAVCRRHLRQGPVWMEDSPKAAAMYGIKAALKEDSASCYICVARAAALNRIKAAGGDSIKAAEDSELRARGEICVIKCFPPAKEEGKAEPVGVVKQTAKVPGSYIKDLLTGSVRLTPFRPLDEDYFQRNPNHRVPSLSGALVQLSFSDEMDNILCQFFEKGYAMMEVQGRYPREV